MLSTSHLIPRLHLLPIPKRPFQSLLTSTHSPTSASLLTLTLTTRHNSSIVKENFDRYLQNPVDISRIRNYAIIAHVDHGKSSLASRLLEVASEAPKVPVILGKTLKKKTEYEKEKEAALEKQRAEDRKKAKEDISSLDNLKVEKERGITVKATAASMLYTPSYELNSPEYDPKVHLPYLLNFVDTPGHVDFQHEVSRTLKSVSGALILFDSTQGVQAQSFSVHDKASELGLPLIPVLTKIDLEGSRAIEVALSVSEVFSDFDPDEIILTSARQNIGMIEVLDSVCLNIPPPSPTDYTQTPEDNRNDMLRARVVDSWFEPMRGVVCLLQIVTGQVNEGDRVTVIGDHPDLNDHQDSSGGGPGHFSVQELGFVLPGRHRTKVLKAGHMGYAVIGMRNPRQARPGGTLVLHKDLGNVEKIDFDFRSGRALNSKKTDAGAVEGDMSEEESERLAELQSLAGLKRSSVLYASVHPSSEGTFDDLVAAVDRLALNDMGLEVSRQSSMGSANESKGPWLGPGLKVGFQGLLHVEIFRQRLLDEFDVEALVTSPKVPYVIEYTQNLKKPRASDLPTRIVVEDLNDWPDSADKYHVLEPMVNLRVMAPADYAGTVMDIIQKRRGSNMTTKVIDERTWLFTALIPWAEVVTDFHDELKSLTAGYASFDTYESKESPFMRANLSKVEIQLNGDPVEPLCFVAHADVAQAQGRSVCEKLQDVLPRQQFPIAVQAKIGSLIIARTTVKPFRKDVLIKSGKTVGGGDISRKKKLLEKQKAGKKRLAGSQNNGNGRVMLSQEAFNSVISR